MMKLKRKTSADIGILNLKTVKHYGKETYI
jgi:hypothetical protein